MFKAARCAFSPCGGLTSCQVWRPHPEERTLGRVSKDGRRRTASRDKSADTPSPSRGALRPSCAQTASPSEEQRAQGMPGARCARSRVWCVESTRVSHHGHTGNTRHSPRNGFTAYIALSRVTGLSCHPRRRSCLHQLDASVGASGPHDFAVRKMARSSAALLASTAFRAQRP